MPDNRSVCGECGDVYGEEWCPDCSCPKPSELICRNNQYLWKDF